MLEVKLNNAGYDPFIDFLKGLCIVWVVLTHSIPYEWLDLIGFPFWGAQAVPLFLLIQSYHYFKKDTSPSIKWKKLFQRIVVPFVAVQGIILVSLLLDYYCFQSGLLSTPIVNFIKHGGGGPGSFYFWIYLQFALILLPLFGWLQKRLKLSLFWLAVVFILISEAAELIYSYTHPELPVYRLSATRYIMLVYGGYIWAKDGIKLNWCTILLSVVSIVAIYLLQYRGLEFEPWIYSAVDRYFHWFCYFFAIWLLVSITNALFKIGGGRFAKLFQTLGKYSYEIFIFQMMVFFFFPGDLNPWIYLTATTLLSIIPVVAYKLIREKCVK